MRTTIATTGVPAGHGPFEIEYDTFGDPSSPPVLLVMGFTAQMTLWDPGFCELLAERGHHVIRFDNRDVGLSSKLDGITVDMAAVLHALGSGDVTAVPPVPYRLGDMANDAFGLLDALGIASAHIVGASMGGMIVQTMAIEQPQRVRSMTSIMSTTGEPEYFRSSPEAQAALLTPPPQERAAYIDAVVAGARVFSSKTLFDEPRVRARVASDYDRSFYPEGASRQLAAIVASGDRADGLRQLPMPALVVHGLDDSLIEPIGGRRTAELVGHAHLLEVAQMGHDLPAPLWPEVVEAITALIGRAEAAATPA